MKKLMRISVFVVAMLMAFTVPSQAHGGRGDWGWGPALDIGLLGPGLWEISQPYYYIGGPVALLGDRIATSYSRGC
jgi:hypothetical protein